MSIKQTEYLTSTRICGDACWKILHDWGPIINSFTTFLTKKIEWFEVG